MAIKPEFIISLKGKSYPIWAGILAAATEAGLKSLRTQVIQFPHPENGNLAVVMATATFDDGRTFEDVGDCSPLSTSVHLAAASIRLASTRAKGRCLRDALNVGETMFEELPGEARNGHDEGQREAERPVQPRQVNQENGHGAAEGVAACQECGLVMTPAQRKLSIHKYGGSYCVEHQRGRKVMTTIG